MDGGAWQATVHGVAKSWIRLSDFTFAFHFYALPCPPPGDPPDLGIEPTSLMSPALADRLFIADATWEAPEMNVML